MEKLSVINIIYSSTGIVNHNSQVQITLQAGSSRDKHDMTNEPFSNLINDSTLPQSNYFAQLCDNLEFRETLWSVPVIGI